MSLPYRRTADAAGLGTDYDVIVLGAGVAGLTVADSLLRIDRDLKVLVLEARDRIGGRVHSIALDEIERDAELGAWYVQDATGEPWSVLLGLGLKTAAVGNHTTVMPGMSSITEALASSSPGKVQLNSEVSEIFWRDQLVGVNYGSQGLSSAVTARRLVITLPAAVLREGGPTIMPPLPAEKRRALNAVEGRAAVSASMLFDADKARLAGGETEWLRETDTARLRAFQSGYAGELLLEAQFLGARAEAMSGQPADLVLNLALRAFADALESMPSLSDVRFSAATDWRSDKYSRGAQYQLPSDAHLVFTRSLSDTVFFAGDWTVEPTLAGTLRGAHASGERAARQVALSLGALAGTPDPNTPVLLELL